MPHVLPHRGALEQRGVHHLPPDLLGRAVVGDPTGLDRHHPDPARARLARPLPPHRLDHVVGDLDVAEPRHGIGRVGPAEVQHHPGPLPDHVPGRGLGGQQETPGDPAQGRGEVVHRPRRPGDAGGRADHHQPGLLGRSESGGVQAQPARGGRHHAQVGGAVGGHDQEQQPRRGRQAGEPEPERLLDPATGAQRPDRPAAPDRPAVSSAAGTVAGSVRARGLPPASSRSRSRTGTVGRAPASCASSSPDAAVRPRPPSVSVSIPGTGNGRACPARRRP